MGKTNTISDPEVFKTTQDMTQVTAKLRRAIKFGNIARIDDIVATGNRIISRSNDLIALEAYNNWKEQLDRATEFKRRHGKTSKN